MPTTFPKKLKDGTSLRTFFERELHATKLVGKGANEQERRDNAARAIAIAAGKANQVEGSEVYGLRSKHRPGWSRLALKNGDAIGTFSDLLAYREPFLSVDCIAGAESSKAKPGGWTHEGPVKDDRHRFVAPSELVLSSAEPAPAPAPDGDLRAELDALKARVAALEQPRRVALKAVNNGLYVRVSLDSPTAPLQADRAAVGEGETFIEEPVGLGRGREIPTEI